MKQTHRYCKDLYQTWTPISRIGLRCDNWRTSQNTRLLLCKTESQAQYKIFRPGVHAPCTFIWRSHTSTPADSEYVPDPHEVQTEAVMAPERPQLAIRVNEQTMILCWGKRPSWNVCSKLAYPTLPSAHPELPSFDSTKTVQTCFCAVWSSAAIVAKWRPC